MAMRVPTVSGPTIAPQGLPAARQSSIASPELLGAGARQLQSAGGAMENLGAQLQDQRRRLYDQANAARVDDALNDAMEHANRLQHDKTEGYTTQTGYGALNRESGMPLADEYTGKLKERVDKIAGTLSNDDQRRMFSARANNLVTGFHGGAMAYEAKEQQGYTLSVKDATVSSARNALALNPEAGNVATQTTRIRGAIEGGQDENGTFIPGSAQMLGKSAAWAKEKADEAVSDAHGNAIKALLQGGNVNGAMSHFKRYGGDMTAKDTLEIRGTLQHEYDTHVGATVGNQVFDGAAPKIQPSGYTRLTALVQQQESGGKRFGTDGQLLRGPVTRSGERAEGEMQVMPATYKNPGYGIKPADLSGTPEQRADEIARVGHQKLEVMIKRYNGDLSKALAAYNWGEGNVDKAVAEAAAETKSGAFRGGAPGPDYWLTKAPPETRNYVAGITAKYGAGEGAPEKPTLAELHDEVRARLGPNATPTMVKTATDQVTQRFTDADKAVKQRSEEVVANAMKEIERVGGRYSELPPNVRADLSRLAPDKVDSVMNFGVRVSKGDDTTNPALYTRLSDPNVLRGMSEQQLYGLRGQLSQSDYQHFAGERAKLLNPTGSTGPGDLNSQAVANAVGQRLRELKIDPTPKDGSDDAARVGSIRRFIDTQILSAQQQQGKKFTDAETIGMVDKLFSQSTELKGWFSNYSGPALGAKVSDIPKDTRTKIEGALKKRGVTDPSDAQILNAFLHLTAPKQ